MSWSGARPVLLVLAVVATLGAFGWSLLSGGGSDDEAAAPATTSTPSAPVLSVDPTRDAPAPSPTTEPTTEPTVTACEDENTRFNADGTQGDSLLPDCGQQPVTKAQQQTDGLSLACGGDYPVILYKSTTNGSKASICGKDAVGDRFRVVIKPDGSDTLDLSGTYDWRRDAYVATHDGDRYVLHAVDGSLHVTRDGTTRVEPSKEWISLDNETDDL
ncbi:hypothetical protein IDH50_08445 [Aeromicrobium tamlense]|uniref:Uncharacterized protein n=1 Tax=Aeromicrobium tamlense TaxID=375541 RepID=A0A8I0FWJ0_9ACTN|nr:MULTISPECIES: hypothetical protein [Aeromicrobium]MBD1270256.1 hypothetical protein [Aeromicrobium tamlense]NYI39086.1 hypothetical protein [Aeromicrobium tamlense]